MQDSFNFENLPQNATFPNQKLLSEWLLIIQHILRSTCKTLLTHHHGHKFLKFSILRLLFSKMRPSRKKKKHREIIKKAKYVLYHTAVIIIIIIFLSFSVTETIN